MIEVRTVTFLVGREMSGGRQERNFWGIGSTQFLSWVVVLENGMG